MKSMNDQIKSMLATLIYTSVKTNKQYKKTKELSSKLSTYEDRLEKMSNKETQLQPLALQVKKQAR